MSRKRRRLIRIAVLGGLVAWWVKQRKREPAPEGIWRDATPPPPPAPGS